MKVSVVVYTINDGDWEILVYRQFDEETMKKDVIAAIEGFMLPEAVDSSEAVWQKSKWPSGDTYDLQYDDEIYAALYVRESEVI